MNKVPFRCASLLTALNNRVASRCFTTGALDGQPKVLRNRKTVRTRTGHFTGLTLVCDYNLIVTKHLTMHIKHFSTFKTLDSTDMSLRVTSTEMKRFLELHKIKYEDGHTCLTVKSCPICLHLDTKQAHPLFINKTSCTFLCFSCQQSGSWTTLVETISETKGKKRDLKMKADIKELKKSDVFPSEDGVVHCQSIYNSALPFDRLTDEEFDSVTAKFNLQGLSRDSFVRFNVRVAPDMKSLIFPFTSWPHYKLVGVEIFEKLSLTEILNETKELGKDKEFIENLVPFDITLGVFGLHLLSKSQEVVITQTPQDALAVFQQTNLPAVSFPSYNGMIQLRPEVLPFFEHIKKITIWFGDTSSDWDQAKRFCRKFGEKRCYLVSPDEKNKEILTPLKALGTRQNLSNYLKSAKPVAHQSITTFKTLRHALFSELKDPMCSGVLWNRFPELNRHLKGHRSGELTVFTGRTGCGKTTFMSEYSLDLAMQGVRTLWGSFEVKNVRLAKMMLTQYSEKNLINHLEEFDQWADRFEQLPIYYMTFHGQESIKNVLSAMAHAVYMHDIKHIIIDNIQFMLGCDASQYKFDRFWQQDLVLDAFRKFATREDCHVTLVIHPRKEDDLEELNNNSIFGGAKASQEADNILILQTKWWPQFKCQKYVEITKNRWDGDLGKVPLWFDKESMSYSPKSRRSNELVFTNDNFSRKLIRQDDDDKLNVSSWSRQKDISDDDKFFLQ